MHTEGGLQVSCEPSSNDPLSAIHKRNPQIPAIFSQSLVMGLTWNLFGQDWTPHPGGRRCDILLRDGAGREMTVQVKGTGDRGFQELKAGDRTADWFVWVHFGDRFQTATGPIEVILVRELRSPWRVSPLGSP